MTQTEEKRPFMVNESGRTIYLRAIDLYELEASSVGIEAEYRERGEPIDPPTYTVEVEGGDTYEKPLTERALELMPDSPKRQEYLKAWVKHQEAHTRMRVEQQEIEMEIVLDGVDEELPEDDTWERVRKRRRISIPDDPYEKLLYYKKHVLLPTPNDAMTLYLQVYKLSSSGAVPQAYLDAAQNLFRSSVQKVADELEGDAAEGFTDQKGPLVA